MNKIIVKNDLIESDNKNIIINSSLDLVKKYEIIFNSSSDLEIIYDGVSKLDIEFILDSNISVNIYEFRTSSKAKVKYKYTLKDNANLYLYRLNDCLNINESDHIVLNGINSTVDFNLRTLTGSQDNYDILISHENKNTKSTVNNMGISLNGNTNFNVTGSVLKGCTNSNLDQNNQIVAFDTSKCKINPNLLIDEYDVLANHNAVIGKFDDDVIFYLMSRGINKSDAFKLISEGLILKNLNNDEFKDRIKKIIGEYWG